MEINNSPEKRQGNEAENPSQKRLLIFGQGPIIDSESRIKAADASTQLGKEDMNLWGHGLAEAGAILYKRGVIGEIIVMGGRTGGAGPEGDYNSEAEIIKAKLVSFEVPLNAIKLEQTSTNTLENITNFMDQYLSDASEGREFSLLGTDYHIARIRILMELFNIPYQVAFSSEAVLKAVEYEKVRFWNSETLLRLDKQLSLNDTKRVAVSDRDAQVKVGFYDDKLGAEQKNYWVRYHEEDAFTRMLLEVPEYWMTYVGRIKNDDQLKKVLSNIDAIFPGYLENLSLSQDRVLIDNNYLTIVRSTLGAIARPDIAKWIREEMPGAWPEETKAKLERFHEARTGKK